MGGMGAAEKTIGKKCQSVQCAGLKIPVGTVKCMTAGIAVANGASATNCRDVADAVACCTSVRAQKSALVIRRF